MKAARLVAILVCLLPAPLFAQISTPSEPDLDRFHYFVTVAVLSPSPYALSLAGAVLDEIGDFPEDWTDGHPFVKRYLARQGMSLASDAIGHSLGALIGHRVRYDMCACSGFSRVRHGMARAFVSRTTNGSSAPNYSLWVAKFSAAGLANTWYPASYTASDIVREGAVGIMVSGGLNVLKEFSPELLRMVGIGK
jgi:hypothetical protein